MIAFRLCFADIMIIYYLCILPQLQFQSSLANVIPNYCQKGQSYPWVHGLATTVALGFVTMQLCGDLHQFIHSAEN